MPKPKKTTFKMIESEWKHYHDTLREIVKIRSDIMNPFQSRDDNRMGSSNTISKPTESIAIRLTTSKQLNYLTELTDSIEQVYNAIPPEYQKLIRLRYWSNRNLSWDQLSDELHISKRTAQRWRDEIIIATIELMGLR